MASVTTAADPTREELSAALSSPDALYEIVDGRIVEVPGMSYYANVIARRLMNAILGANQPGQTFFENMFIIDVDRNLRRRPDVAFVSAERWPLDRLMPTEGDMEVVPDLVVEVISPNDRGGDIAKKIREYFRYNVRQVWVVQPVTQEIALYRSPKQIEVFEEGDELKAEDILPGLKVALTALFSRTIDV